MKNRLANAARAFRNEIRLYKSILADPCCPRVARWLLAGAVVYALSPLDLIPDFIPVIGHFDDVLVLSVLVWLAMRFIPREVVEEHRKRCRKME